MLDVRRLRVLVEVADRRSFHAAADALSFTQPSVSRHIAALEREVGTLLVDRTRGNIGLTQAGEIAVAHARIVLARLALAEEQLNAFQSARGGPLRVGAFASANTWLVPTAFERFARRYPDVDLSLEAGSTVEHPRRLLDGTLDVALVTDWDTTGGGRGALDLVPLLEDEMVLALPRDHRLAQIPGPVTLESLAEESWIEGPHPDCLGPLDGHGAGVAFAPRVKFVCEDLVGKQALVAAGMGVTLLPGLSLPEIADGIVVRRIADVHLPRRVYAAFCADGFRVPAVDTMVETLRQVAAVVPARHRAVLPVPRPSPGAAVSSSAAGSSSSEWMRASA